MFIKMYKGEEHMDSAGVKAKDTKNTDLYASQFAFDQRKAKIKVIYSLIFLAASVISLVMLFVVPLYKYTYSGENISINGEYTSVYIIQKYFANELGATGVLNTGLIISLFVLIILSVYLLVGGIVNIICKKTIKDKKALSKLFNYSLLEILCVVMFLALFASMLFCKIDVSGKAENGLSFWVLFATSIFMICTSIPLSDK